MCVFRFVFVYRAHTIRHTEIPNECECLLWVNLFNYVPQNVNAAQNHNKLCLRHHQRRHRRDIDVVPPPHPTKTTPINTRIHSHRNSYAEKQFKLLDIHTPIYIYK